MSAKLGSITIQPDQATRIATVAVQTGTALGLSQSGSTIIIHLDSERPIFIEGKYFKGNMLRIDELGEPIEPQKEHLFAQEDYYVRESLHQEGSD